jgi:hypothetical protein
MRLGCRQAPPTPRRRIPGGRQRGGDLAELRSGRRRAPTERVRRRPVECRCHGRVWPLGGKRHVTCPLLLVACHGGEASVRLAASPRRRILIADRCEQRMGEAHTLGVELDDSRSGGTLEPLENLRSVAVCGDQRSDCRPREGSGKEQNVATRRWKPGNPRAHDLTETAGNRKRAAGGRHRVRELAADLQREERVAPGHLPELRQLRRRELQSQAMLEDLKQHRGRERLDREPMHAVGREPPIELA